MQFVASFECFLERIRQFTCAHLAIVVGCLELTVLIHQALVLFEQALVLSALCLELLLPDIFHGRFFAEGSTAAHDPPKHYANNQSGGDDRDMCNSDFRHVAELLRSQSQFIDVSQHIVDLGHCPVNLLPVDD